MEILSPIFVMRQAETKLGIKISPSFGAREGQHQIRRHSRHGNMRIRDRADPSFITHGMASHGLLSPLSAGSFFDGCKRTSLGLGFSCSYATRNVTSGLKSKLIRAAK